MKSVTAYFYGNSRGRNGRCPWKRKEGCCKKENKKLRKTTNEEMKGIKPLLEETKPIRPK